MCKLKGFNCANVHLVADCPVIVFWRSHQRQTFHQDLTLGFCGTSKFELIHVVIWRLRNILESRWYNPEYIISDIESRVVLV